MDLLEIRCSRFIYVHLFLGKINALLNLCLRIKVYCLLPNLHFGDWDVFRSGLNTRFWGLGYWPIANNYWAWVQVPLLDCQLLIALYRCYTDRYLVLFAETVMVMPFTTYILLIEILWWLNIFFLRWYYLRVITYQE